MRSTSATWLCLSALAILTLSGCGTPGAPQPPSLDLAKPVSDLKATRTGDQVTLSWTIPTETTDGAAFRHRGPTKICRMLDQPQMNQCAAAATLDIPDQKTATVTRDLPGERTGPNDYATYAVEVNNERGRSAGLSNQVQIPTASVSKLNGTPAAQLTPDAVIVTTNLTPLNDAVRQVLELRRVGKGTPQETTVARRMLELPMPGEAANIELRDETFDWEKTYEYRVVLVGSAKVPNGTEIAFDAASSAPLEVVAHDVFPPAVPTGVQAVFSGSFAGQQSSIDLTWNPDSDRDLAGYFVYRRRQDEPASSAAKLTAQPVVAPSYRDAAIQPGNTYFYSVSAVDVRGNESKRSEETSEQVPK